MLEMFPSSPVMQPEAKSSIDYERNERTDKLNVAQLYILKFSPSLWVMYSPAYIP